MAHDNHEQVDAVSGVTTTGHSWDYIQELNNPLPRWWLWTFYACIAWAIGYCIAYPAWPMVSSYTKGVLGWQSRDAVVADLEALKQQRSGMTAKLAESSLDGIRQNPEMFAFARAQGKAAFGDNCAPCHGAGGAGAKGYPNLNDDDWLWGGSLAQIEQTIRYGARSTSDQGHSGSMPAFGRDGMLKREEIVQAADYVRSLSGLSTDKGADLAAGAKVFADNCAACHGEKGLGNQELGAPNLTDQIWLFGSDKATIVEGLMNGRGGVMPTWHGRLDDTTIKSLTLYVHSLGGDQRR
ncbi:cytochrome-c oxidase, cbb3-type subunit III [Microvirga lotononidis]|uniref:Cbb3-type cytochrome c oxidase subunit n=1 Tax=Microvirga lotononidis TaxID=864069 RepID=I4Z0P3_9HYPH|nr:cytochrome-c oxidase, cbb3-type subunit III [Microvirga lotononidis]EIM29785.1 cytochrome c oxidase, cbb3-type, subunit III [Microvirga lotononidis]WQO26917.1 cytochrome-c oxidase, cbb3-type subunit III [Microvirga lotononidis]